MLQERGRLTDGSIVYNNGAIGPSTLDIQLSELAEDKPSKKSRIRWQPIALSGGVLFTAAACTSTPNIPVETRPATPPGQTQTENPAPTENSNSYDFGYIPNPEGKSIQTGHFDHIFPVDLSTDKWYFTGGLHDNYEAIDFAPSEAVSCPQDPVTSTWAVATESGTVTHSGLNFDNGTGNNEDFHAGVSIKSTDGTFGYDHLANIQVSDGDSVTQGQKLGNPSCELPGPNWSASAPHVHFRMEYGPNNTPFTETQAALANIELSGFQIMKDPQMRPYYGTLVGPDGETLTASVGHCDTTAQCDGLANLLPGSPEPATNTVPIPETQEGQIEYARAAAFSEWLDSFNINIPQTDPNSNFLQVQIENYDEIKLHIPDILAGTYNGTLNIKWVGSKVEGFGNGTSTSGNTAYEKYSGEAKIEVKEVVQTGTFSDGGIAVEIRFFDSWHGKQTVTYNNRPEDLTQMDDLSQIPWSSLPTSDYERQYYETTSVEVMTGDGSGKREMNYDISFPSQNPSFTFDFVPLESLPTIILKYGGDGYYGLCARPGETSPTNCTYEEVGSPNTP